MTATYGPTVGRRRLRSALRAAREAAGFTQEQVAQEMDWSLSKVIRIESGAVGVSPIDARALLRLYGVTEKPRIDELVGLARSSRARKWWSSYASALPAPYTAYIGLEAETSSVLCYTPTKLPALFQTEAYATKAVRRGQATSGERSVEVRLARQREVLGKDHPPHITAVIDEAVVRRIASDPRTKREQLERLVSLAGEPNITIQVLPFAAGVDGFPNPFAILEFPDPADAVMYLENGLGDDVVDQPDLVKPYRHEFDRLREMALSPAETQEMIKRIVGELE
jgi:transcriptional regulator with XRE-family HTH domain